MRGILRCLVVAAALLAGGGATTTAVSAHAVRAQGISLEPLYALRSHTGAPFTPADVKGRPFVVVFGFTHCPNVCPTTLVEMGHLLDTLREGGDKIKVVFVTVDPERDTAEALKSYLASFDPRIIGLTGSLLDITAATSAFNAFFEKVGSGESYTIDHTLKIFFVDKYGLLARAQPSNASLKDNLKIVRKMLNQ